MLSRSLSRATRKYRNFTTGSPAQVRAATHPYAYRRQQHFVRSVAFVTALGATASAWQWATGDSLVGEVHAEAPKDDQDEGIKFEAPRPKPASNEENRAIISSQHLQVVKSWENPGVYAWGSNAGRVVAPDSDEKYIKTPRRIRFFDGKLLRDIKLDKAFGAAIDEKGNLLQWGTDFAPGVAEPTTTLRGKNLTSLSISRDRIIALSSNGSVYSIPVSRAEQQNGPKPTTASWIPFWPSTSNISYRTRTPQGLSWGERVTHISSGLEHALMLTSSGRVFSFASGTQDFPSKGQLGIPGLTWTTRPAGAFDAPHELTTLKGFPIQSIATGDHHSLVSDKAGRAFAFGDNTCGQLGLPFNAEAPTIDTPSLLPTTRLYPGTATQAKITAVFAGGNTSYFTVDASLPNNPRISADTFGFGFGLTGQLGTGRWVHAASEPVRIPTFSSLFEWDEALNRAIPIRLLYMSIGATHAAAVMNNVASVRVPPPSYGVSRPLTPNDTNWGRDILFWGNNEFYQLGTGKRANAATPTYIQPLDHDAEDARVAVVAQGTAKALREKNMHRFQITPRQWVKIGGKNVQVEQKVECGRGVTAVFSAV